MSLLEIDALQARLGDAHILQDISLNVNAGEVVSLLGRNGAGKSTTLKTIVGWVKPLVGTIRYAGRDIGGLATERIVRSGICFIPEDRRVFPALTVEENIRLGFFQSPSAGRREREARLHRMYEWFPRLRERRLQIGKTLSGGEQQMLSIARGLIGDPKLVLIDEPTEGLAPLIVREIFESIKRMRERGLGVLLVEQNVRGALKVSDRCVVIDRGRTIAQGTPQEISDNEAIRRRLAV